MIKKKHFDDWTKTAEEDFPIIIELPNGETAEAKDMWVDPEDNCIIISLMD